MKKIINTFKKCIPVRGEISRALLSLSKKEYFVFLVLFTILLVTAVLLLVRVNNFFTEKVPTQGGSISEGIIGIPRFINPVLAVSDADRDLTALIYSGLMKKGSDGAIVPDLAESYSVSEDGLVYTFVIKNDAVFHDKEPVTADDVVYTIQQIKDNTIKSPKKVSWEGVTPEKIDARTIAFRLKTPYAQFLENTTIGILPSHIWSSVSAEEFSFSDYNTNAIGSGLYKIESISKSSSGVPRYYVLVPAKRLSTVPFIEKLTIRFYANENDLVSGLTSKEVDNIGGISPDNAFELATKGYRIETTVLPRMFGVFFNQNQAPVFLNKPVVNALSMAIDKERIIAEVLREYGEVIDGPVPKSLLGVSEAGEEQKSTHANRVEEAKKLLAKDGWKMGPDGILEKKLKKETQRLSFSISTGDTAELKRAAELIQQDFAAIGAEVELKVFDTGSLNQSVIRPRKYDALFFGQVIGRESDLFAFWHSSQRNDPGLNIAMYANSTADKALEKSLTIQNPIDRAKQYLAFQSEFAKDIPAVFVYSPQYIYVVGKNIKNVSIDNMTIPTERFGNIGEWYIETENIWKIFVKNNY
ncbi:MAG: peptide ABC transporter substrate-binding protein [Candidatus Pacebacteria bacterium]|jgi:peptide/nickel transport system substrate-binding protein|nr:peptide ABC transporter substrate-binding protein [Candidatus Paceibacterota bacterium]